MPNHAPERGEFNFSLPVTAVTNVWGPVSGPIFPQAQVANTLYLVAFAIAETSNLTGIQFRNDTPLGNNVKVSLYNAAGTSLLASSGSVAQAGAFSVQLVPFTVPYQAQAGMYLMGFQIDGTSGHIVTHTPFSPSTSAAQGAFTVPTTATPPTTTERNSNTPLMATY
jgi:hypothetical protein